MPTVIPGQAIAGTPGQDYDGYATYSRDGKVFSAVMGESLNEDGETIVLPKRSVPAIPQEGSLILGKVTRLSRNQAQLEFLEVDGCPCRDEFPGIIRSQDVRQTLKDQVKIWQCFRTGDIVVARVISLGDPRAYYLTTAKNSLGVIYAVSQTSGEFLVPHSWNSMIDPTTGTVEYRKVASRELASEDDALAAQLQRGIASIFSK